MSSVQRFAFVACLLFAAFTVEAAIPTITGSANTGPFEYTGYMSDVLCVNQRFALDGADMLLRPQDHTLHCLVDVAACYESGFCLQQQDTSTSQWHCAYTFTNAQTLDIRTKMLQNRVERRNLLVTFSGSWDSNARLVPDMNTFRYADSVSPATTTTTGVPPTTTTTPSTGAPAQPTPQSTISTPTSLPPVLQAPPSFVASAATRSSAMATAIITFYVSAMLIL